MKVLAVAICLLLTFGVVQGDLTFSSFNGDFSSLDSTAGAIPLSDLITVANYYGCRTWNKNQCTECSEGYFFNKKGVCCEVSPLCSKFNRAEGVCEACYQGYSISNGSCALAAQDTGCALWNGNTCVQCSKRWYSDNGLCTPVADQCYTWADNGNCLTCYNGYVLKNGRCILDPSPFSAAENILCATWSGKSCLACAERAYFDAFKICQPVDDQCQTWDAKDGFCLTCYAGYDLADGKCKFSPSNKAAPSDLGCSLWNYKASICLRCSSRFVFNTNQICTPVSDLCSTYDNSGLCTACYVGYDLSNGQCLVSTKNSKPSDLGCATWDWKNQKCLACSHGWVFKVSDDDETKELECEPVSDLCKDYDSHGVCCGCYLGYNLVDGQCVLAPIEHVTDLGCATWDWNNQVCLKCSNNWVFNWKNECVPVSDKCSTFDATGACLTCYVGYNLNNGQCVLAPVQKVSDVGCATWDWKNQKCLKCSEGWVFNKDQTECQIVSDLCKTFYQSGACSSCYEGYSLSNGKCAANPVEHVSDVGCATWDWKNKKCLACSEKWAFNNERVCVPISDHCKTASVNGDCTSCFVGYNLKNGRCELAPTERVSDVGCATWDWKNQKCLACSENWVFNNGVCVPVSDQCRTFDSTGACTGCYVGYNLNKGKCSPAPIEQVSDLGCATWDWKNQKCLACSRNWVFNTLEVCVPVSDQCKTFYKNGACSSCYLGYNLDNGKCVLAPVQRVSDVGCGTWDWTNQVCLACSARFVFNAQKVCVPVSDNCNAFNSAGSCTSCFNGYVLNKGRCELGNSLCRSADSNGACTECYSGYVLNNGNCVPISKLANLALYYSQCCPERLAALTASVNSHAP